eukprot:3557792-Pleurochrysis_carterae.AAC.1
MRACVRPHVRARVPAPQALASSTGPRRPRRRRFHRPPLPQALIPPRPHPPACIPLLQEAIV